MNILLTLFPTRKLTSIYFQFRYVNYFYKTTLIRYSFLIVYVFPCGSKNYFRVNLFKTICISDSKLMVTYFCKNLGALFTIRWIPVFISEYRIIFGVSRLLKYLIDNTLRFYYMNLNDTLFHHYEIKIEHRQTELSNICRILVLGRIIYKYRNNNYLNINMNKPLRGFLYLDLWKFFERSNQFFSTETSL